MIQEVNEQQALRKLDLTEAEAARPAEIIDNAPEPNEALRDAVAAHDDMTNLDGGPAFPIHAMAAGLSKRDWFAGKALQGWLATYGDNDFPDTRYHPEIAKRMFALADAMIGARGQS